MLIRLSLLLLLVALIVQWGVAAALWPQLPATIPLHFNGSGIPDRTGPATFVTWFMLPAIGTALGVLLGGIGLALPGFARRYPAWINLPNKAAFLMRRPEERVWIIEPIAAALVADGVVMQALFATIAYGTERVANGAWSNFPAWIPLAFVLPAVLVPLAGAIVSIARNG